MTLTVWIKVTAAIVVLAVVVAIGVAWRAEMGNRDELAAELASTKKALEDAEARQRERDAKLADTLAVIAAQKRAVQSPAQIVAELPKQMGLPVAITLQSVPQAAGAGATAPAGSAGGGSAAATRGSNQSTNEINTEQDPSKVHGMIPGQDLKPLYDFALDCQACQAKLAASQSDLVDEQGKTKALTKERDDALRVARGGSIWRRIGRASKWMLIGAAAGAVAARAVH